MIAATTSGGAWAGLAVGITILTAVVTLIWRSARWSTSIELSVKNLHECTDRRFGEVNKKIGKVRADARKHERETAEHHKWIGKP